MAPRRGSRSKPLRGYSKVSKSRWRTPSGKEISDYEYRSRVARKQGWGNYYQVEKFHKSNEYRSWKFDVVNNPKNWSGDKAGEGHYIGPDTTYKGRLVRDAFVTRQKQARRETIVTTHGQRIRADETELGRLLIALGRIPEDAEWQYA